MARRDSRVPYVFLMRFCVLLTRIARRSPRSTEHRHGGRRSAAPGALPATSEKRQSWHFIACARPRSRRTHVERCLLRPRDHVVRRYREVPASEPIVLEIELDPIEAWAGGVLRGVFRRGYRDQKVELDDSILCDPEALIQVRRVGLAGGRAGRVTSRSSADGDGGLGRRHSD